MGVREFDPIFKPLTFTGRVRKAVDLSRSLRSRGRHRVAKLSSSRKVAIASLAVAAFFLMAIALPAAATGGSLVFGYWKLHQAQANLTAFNFKDASYNAEAARSAFDLASSETAEFELPLNLLGHHSLFVHVSNFLSAQAYISSSLAKLSSSAQTVSDLSSHIVASDITANVSSQDTQSALDRAAKDLQDSQHELATSSEYEKDSRSFLSALINSNLSKQISNLQGTQKQLSFLIKIWPTITATGGERTYLVLVADSHNLNLGGGEVVGAGILSFQQSKLRSIMFDDVSSISSHRSPVFQSFLGNKNLNTTVISSSPDLPSSVSTLLSPSAAGLHSIDGVLIIDDFALSSLLNIVGPVHPAGYDIEVNSQNISLLSHAQLSSSPSSKGILTATASEVVAKALRSSPSLYPSLTTAITSFLSSKHLLLSLSDSTLKNYAEAKGWDGALLSQNILGFSSDSISDFLMINVISNGNQSGKWQSKFDTAYSLRLQYDGSLQAHLQLTLTNTSANGSDYPHQESFKIFAPHGSSLQSSSKAASSYQESGFTTFTIPYQTAPGEVTKVDLIYNLPFKISSSTKRYLLQVHKQNGSSNYSFQLNQEGSANQQQIGPSGSYTIDHDLTFTSNVTLPSR